MLANSNSMDEDISSNYMCYPTAKELYDNVNQMYFDLGKVWQGNDSVT